MLHILDIFFVLGLGLEGFFFITAHKDLTPSAFPIVPEGATTNRVDNNEEYKEDNVHISHFFPGISEVVEQTGLAGLAVVA